MSWRRIHIPTLWMALMVGLQSCASETSLAPDAWGFLTPIEALTTEELGSEQKPRVVSTTTLVGDLLQNVGGEHLEREVLFEPGVDPHAFEPTPGDLTALFNAHVIFVNGFGLEESLQEILALVSESVPIVSLSEGIQPLSFGAQDGRPNADQRLRGSDPHVWLDPTNVIQWADNAAMALSLIDPAHAQEYRSRRDAYVEELKALDSAAVEQVARISPEDRILVTDHNSLGYFAARYGFQIAGAVISADSTLAEPSAQELAALTNEIRRLGPTAIFVSETSNPATALRLAEDTGARLVPLYIGSLSPPDGPATSLIELLKYNVDAIVNALSP